MFSCDIHSRDVRCDMILKKRKENPVLYAHDERIAMREERTWEIRLIRFSRRRVGICILWKDGETRDFTQTRAASLMHPHKRKLGTKLKLPF